MQITDVREQGTLADYAGEVEARANARLTDRNGSGTDPATTTNILFPLHTQCTPTADGESARRARSRPRSTR